MDWLNSISSALRIPVELIGSTILSSALQAPVELAIRILNNFNLVVEVLSGFTNTYSLPVEHLALLLTTKLDNPVEVLQQINNYYSLPVDISGALIVTAIRSLPTELTSKYILSNNTPIEIGADLNVISAKLPVDLALQAMRSLGLPVELQAKVLLGATASMPVEQIAQLALSKNIIIESAAQLGTILSKTNVELSAEILIQSRSPVELAGALSIAGAKQLPIEQLVYINLENTIPISIQQKTASKFVYNIVVEHLQELQKSGQLPVEFDGSEIVSTIVYWIIERIRYLWNMSSIEDEWKISREKDTWRI